VLLSGTRQQVIRVARRHATAWQLAHPEPVPDTGAGDPAGDRPGDDLPGEPVGRDPRDQRSVDAFGSSIPGMVAICALLPAEDAAALMARLEAAAATARAAGDPRTRDQIAADTLAAFGWAGLPHEDLLDLLRHHATQETAAQETAAQTAAQTAGDTADRVARDTAAAEVPARAAADKRAAAADGETDGPVGTEGQEVFAGPADAGAAVADSAGRPHPGSSSDEPAPDLAPDPAPDPAPTPAGMSERRPAPDTTGSARAQDGDPDPTRPTVPPGPPGPVVPPGPPVPPGPSVAPVRPGSPPFCAPDPGLSPALMAALAALATSPLVGTVTAQVHVTLDLATLLGLREHPADLATAAPGHRGTDLGPTLADAARRLAARPDTRWDRFLHDPNGVLLGTSPSYQIPDTLRRTVLAEYQTCTAYGCQRPAAQCDTDHLVAWQPDGTGGHTEHPNLHPADRRHHNHKTHGGWQVQRADDGTITWTSPLGQTVTVDTHDYRGYGPLL